MKFKILMGLLWFTFLFQGQNFLYSEWDDFGDIRWKDFGDIRWQDLDKITWNGKDL